MVACNLAMLQGFRGSGALGRSNRMLHGLVLAICTVGALVTLVPAVARALGLPTLGPAPVLGVLGAPALWTAWRLLRRPLT
jgi:hypothetical protein